MTLYRDQISANLAVFDILLVRSAASPIQLGALLFLAKGLVCNGGRERATYTLSFRQEAALRGLP